jgi:5'-3' exonuclease
MINDRTMITPGTEFMYKLSAGFKNYLIKRAYDDADWFNLTLVWSDAFVTGEGEHKMLDFMRS